MYIFLARERAWVPRAPSELVDGLDAAWKFFGGVTHRVVLDNTSAATLSTQYFARRVLARFDAQGRNAVSSCHLHLPFLTDPSEGRA